MSHLNLSLIGSPQIDLGGEDLTGKLSEKSTALLGYLAVRQAAVSRSSLAGLFWTDHSEDRARGNLRTTLSRLRRCLPAHIGASRTMVWIAGPVTVDVSMLAAIEPSKLASQYRGEFMSGLDVTGAALFEEWRQSESLRVRSVVVTRLTDAAVAAMSDDANASEECVFLCRRLVKIDPWNERAQRLLISALAKARGRLTAVAYFERFEAKLRDELSVSPEEATVRLAQSLMSQEPVIDLRESATVSMRLATRRRNRMSCSRRYPLAN